MTEVRAMGTPDTAEAVAYRKAARRLLPLLFGCYVLAFLDRVNVGFAKLQMNDDLGLTETLYGFGAGLFFVSYFFFEVPSNLLLPRVGARLWIARIMILWGVISAATMFAAGPVSFCAMRFLLGVGEAGFFPGVILYLTFWFPEDRRAGMVAGFMTAIAIAGVVGGPVSGEILKHTDGLAGLRGWQWLYLLEGLPTVLVGFAVLALLPDGPRTARWLTAEERELILRRLADEEAAKAGAGAGHSLGAAVRSGRLWVLVAGYFGIVMGLYGGVTFWMPEIIKQTITTDPAGIGWASALPWGTAAVVMVLNGRHSDATGERGWHTAVPCLVGGVAFAVSAIDPLPGVAKLAALTVATAGVMAAVSCFWAIPPRLLSGPAAAAGIAGINSIGGLAGYLGPFAVGALKDTFGGDLMWPLLMLAGSMISGSALVAAAAPRAVSGERPA